MNAVVTKSQRTSSVAYGTILLSALLFGTYGVWSRLMGPAFSPFYQAYVRSIVIILLMLPFMLASKAFRKIRFADWPGVAAYIGFCVFTQVPLYFAFNNAPIGTVQLIFYSMFIVTAYLVGRFYLKEKITRVKLIAMVLAFAGLALIFGLSIISFSPVGLAMAALNGIASGGEVASSRKVSDKYPPALLTFWGWVFTLITHMPLSFILGEQQQIPQLNQAWLWLLVYSAVNAAAFWLVIVGFQYVDASIGSLIGLMEVVFGVLFGALIFHETISWPLIVGGLLIIAAATLPDLLHLITANVQQNKRVENEPETVN